MPQLQIRVPYELTPAHFSELHRPKLTYPPAVLELSLPDGQSPFYHQQPDAYASFKGDSQSPLAW